MKLSLALLGLVSLSLVCAEDKRLIKWGVDQPPVWMTEAQVLAKRTKWLNFMDVTDHNQTFQARSATRRNPSPIPSGPLQEDAVFQLIPALSAERIMATVEFLSENYHTRHRATEEGEASATWILEQMRGHTNGRGDVSLQLYHHPSVRQPSVIATVEGESDELVVIGGHFDSVAGAQTSRAPGADDDATGTACMMEAFRVLMESGWKPLRTVHFIAFAAEEGGLIGARDIVARKYLGGDVPIMSLLNMEMNGYQVVKKIVVLDDQFTTNEMTVLLGQYVNAYADQDYPVSNEICGYACGDHAAFFEAGYRVACIAEAGPFGDVNPHMHTSGDTMEHITVEQTLQHAKVALAYVIEMSAAPFAP